MTQTSHALQATPPAGTSIRLSSDALPERDRVAMFCDDFARHVLRVQLQPLPECRFKVEMQLRHLKSLTFWSQLKSPMRLDRTRELIAPADDGAILLVLTSGKLVAEQRGQEEAIAPGDALMFPVGEPATFVHRVPMKTVAFHLSRDRLGPLVREFDSLRLRRPGGAATLLSLLLNYAQVLKDDAAMSDPGLRELAITHIYDLAAVLFGATPDAAHMAKGRGLAAARLHAIKKAIVANLNGGLSPKRLAGCYGISPRHIRRLFEREGTSFTEFVREERLKRAHTMLNSPRLAHWHIADIAFEVGFNDLSYFYRAFRARFGYSPGEARGNPTGAQD